MLNHFWAVVCNLFYKFHAVLKHCVMCLYSKGLRQLRSQRSCETEPDFLRWGFWRWDTCRLNFSFYICLNCFSPSSCLTFNKQTELTNPGDQLCCLTAPVRLIPVPAVGFLKGNVLKLPYITCHSNIFNKLKTKQNQKKKNSSLFIYVHKKSILMKQEGVGQETERSLVSKTSWSLMKNSS